MAQVIRRGARGEATPSWDAHTVSAMGAEAEAARTA